MSRSDAALDLIGGVALAGAAAAMLVRPRHVTAIARSPLVPAASRLASRAVRSLRQVAPPPRPRGARKLGRLVSRFGARPTVTQTAGRRLNGSDALLAFSVLADSAVEHYRGSFQNRAMYTPLVTAALTLGASLFGVADKRAARHPVRDTIYGAAAATGFAGLGFHTYNILKRPGHRFAGHLRARNKILQRSTLARDSEHWNSDTRRHALHSVKMTNKRETRGHSRCSVIALLRHVKKCAKIGNEEPAGVTVGLQHDPSVTE